MGGRDGQESEWGKTLTVLPSDVRMRVPTLWLLVEKGEKEWLGGQRRERLEHYYCVVCITMIGVRR